MAQKSKKIKKMVGSGPWASALAEAFGENPNGTFDITLRDSPHEPVRVEIKKYIDANASEIIEVINKVVWVDE